jgi:hypothetical protein
LTEHYLLQKNIKKFVKNGASLRHKLIQLLRLKHKKLNKKQLKKCRLNKTDDNKCLQNNKWLKLKLMPCLKLQLLHENKVMKYHLQ